MKIHSNIMTNKKQIAALVVGIIVLLSMTYATFFTNNESEQPIKTTKTIKVAPPLKKEAVSVVDSHIAINKVALLEQNLSSSELNENIDMFFISKLDPKSIPAIPAIQEPCPKAKLPELRSPSLPPNFQIPPSVSNVVAPASPPLIFQVITISGITCNNNMCKANTSQGNVVDGGIIGGGKFILEHIEAITMHGIKTDKRFINY
ncbi:MAG: hypothetical protein A3F91_09285 [Flavobacteria bacterium RIFCSPLOWO2_12_FULL_35_11]|nr:MAG: hypothetical protein A3F91_09285 [Flavobacteria bacterium RIFCSPLOWO2_12_FULL_35_11]